MRYAGITFITRRVCAVREKRVRDVPAGFKTPAAVKVFEINRGVDGRLRVDAHIVLISPFSGIYS
jgi:hypothetical protein